VTEMKNSFAQDIGISAKEMISSQPLHGREGSKA
jgi:hypothetical protein